MIIEDINGAICVFKGKELTYISPFYIQTFGYSEKVLKKFFRKDPFSLIQKEDRNKAAKDFAKALEGQDENVVLEFRRVVKGGEIYFERAKIDLFYNKKGDLTTGIIHSNYFNEKWEPIQNCFEKENEILKLVSKLGQELIDSNNYVQSLTKTLKKIGEILKVSRVSFFSISTDGRIKAQIVWNFSGLKNKDQSLVQRLRINQENIFFKPLLKGRILKKNLSQIKNPEIRKILIQSNVASFLLLPIFLEGRPESCISFEFKTERNWNWYEYSALNSLAETYTKSLIRLRYHQERDHNHERLQTILNGLPDFIFTIKKDGSEIEFMNDTFSKKLEKVGMNLAIKDLNEIILPEYKNSLKRFFRNAYTKQKAKVVLKTTFEKEYKWIQCTAKEIKYKNEDAKFLVVIRDISKEKEYDKQLLAAHEETQIANKKNGELELRSLQMQMNPHFIFNSLNAIQSYIISNEPLLANSFMTKFSKLMRMSLNSSRNKYISLKEEIELLSLYVEIEQLRFEDKFDFELKIEPNLDQYLEIPTMIIQPFIENAINHGLRYKKTKGTLELIFEKNKNSLKVSIIDNGVGIEKGTEIKENSRRGYKSQGLQITKDRIDTYNLHNFNKMEYSISPTFPGSEIDCGVMVTLKLPLEIEL